MLATDVVAEVRQGQDDSVGVGGWPNGSFRNSGWQRCWYILPYSLSNFFRIWSEKKQKQQQKNPNWQEFLRNFLNKFESQKNIHSISFK